MDYSYLQGLGVDGLLMEERNLCNPALGSFQHSAYNPPYQPMPWSANDPPLLQMNEHAWLNRMKIPPAGNLGVDAGEHFAHQRPNIVTQNSQFNISSDMMMAAISRDSFSFGGDIASHAPWMQMCSLSSDEYLNDAMPQLISDSTAQQPCMYTSSSDCLHEADSSGSSERDRPLSRPGLVSSSSNELNWRNSDVFQENLGGSLLGFHLDGLPDDSSSVVADLDTLDSGRHALSSIVSMPEPATECVPMGAVSWMPLSTIESGDGSSVVSGVVNQHIPSLDPFVVSLSSCSNDAPPYKRHRASHSLNTISTGSLSQPLIPSLSKTVLTSSPGCSYPTTSLNITEALYKDCHVPRRQTLLLPKPVICDRGGRFATKTDQLDNDPRSHRKQNATSVEPQSIAARHRRKKISERVRVLEKLIPGGNKMDTASMLDESIEYVKFLQLQVQLLESLGDMSEISSNGSTSPFYNDSIGGEKDGFDVTGSYGSHASSQSCTTMQQIRPAASPLILSEILQQQLFKQKLCLVSLRQCPPATRCPTSGLMLDPIQQKNPVA